MSEPSAASQHLVDECRLFSRYLIGSEPSAYVIDRYVRHARGLDESSERQPGDALLCGFARAGTLPLRVADAYAARFARTCALRRKLVLALALLECSPPSSDVIDSAWAGGVVAAYVRLTARGVREALCALVGVVLLGVPHAVLRLKAGSGDGGRA